MIDKKKLLQLRKVTLLGMSKCYKALSEAKGDFDKALEILRKEGKKIAFKRAGRSMNEGRIFAKTNVKQNIGLMLGLSCETDFVAKNEGIKVVGDALLDVALTKPRATKEDLLTLPYGETTFGEEIIQLAARTGENISISHCEWLESPIVGVYIHTGNKLAALAGLSMAEIDGTDMPRLARDMAIQVVVSDSLAVDGGSIPSEILVNEKATIIAKLQGTEKPDNVIDKIVEGNMKKFVQQHTLVAQPFVKDETKTVEQVLKRAHPELRTVGFKRLQMGY